MFENKIIINDKKYNNYETDVSLGNFETSYWKNDKIIRRKGVSPFINFNINNKVFLGIETTYPLKMLKKMEFGKKKVISKYITDILYEEGHGWASFNDSKISCYLIRIDNSIFRIVLNIEDKYNDLKIYIDTLIEL